MEATVKQIAQALGVGLDTAARYKKDGVRTLEQSIKLNNYLTGLNIDPKIEAEKRLTFLRKRIDDLGLSLQSVSDAIGMSALYSNFNMDNKMLLVTYEKVINYLIEYEEKLGL